MRDSKNTNLLHISPRPEDTGRGEEWGMRCSVYRSNALLLGPAIMLANGVVADMIIWYWGPLQIARRETHM